MSDATATFIPAGRRVVTLGRWLSLVIRSGMALRGLLVLAAILVASIAILPLGSYEIAPDRVFAAILDPASASPSERLIVIEFRVPRILLASLIGAILGVAGALMQSVTRNGLADPGLIGVTEGASVVIIAILVMYPALDPSWRPLLGMIGGGFVSLLVLALTRGLGSIRFVLVGVGVSIFLSAAISVFMTYGEITRVQAAMVWLAGSLHAASWDLIALVLPWALIGMTIAFLSARAANASLLGDAAATGLGLRTGLLRLVMILTSVALTAASVSAIGSLGFVGLIAPHLARFLIGGQQGALLAGSALGGAALVLFADSIGRLAFAPLQIPTGIVIAVIGVPFFLFLLWRRRHQL